MVACMILQVLNVYLTLESQHYRKHTEYDTRSMSCTTKNNGKKTILNSHLNYYGLIKDVYDTLFKSFCKGSMKSKSR